ncbi:MAG: hypothetical protein OXF56_06590 [Rhodobacteraceae bacterium]|nr:hypothetical protein [Paracoccaceae bacterium]
MAVRTCWCCRGTGVRAGVQDGQGSGDTGTALDAAITQMRERGYAEDYPNRREIVRLVDVVCGCVARNFLENGTATA